MIFNKIANKSIFNSPQNDSIFPFIFGKLRGKKKKEAMNDDILININFNLIKEYFKDTLLF